MDTRQTRCHRVMAVLTLLAMLLTAGCQAHDRAGGVADRTVTELTFATASMVPTQVSAWISEVEQRTRGTLRISIVQDPHAADPAYETKTLADVRNGTTDLAWLGVRVFDLAGVRDFQPLLAPMLIDSLDLQAKVFEEGIPQEMLSGVDRAGVHGIAVLPGPMRTVLGVEKPFTGPADFTRARFGIQDGAVARHAMRTLHATPMPVPAGTALTRLEGYEQQLSSIRGNHYAERAGFLTGNLVLWPRPLVIVVNPAVFDALPADQREAMSTAATHAVSTATQVERDQARDAAVALCRTRITVANAGAKELTALRAAFAPTYAMIAEEPAGRTYLQRIAALKHAGQLPADDLSCGAAASAGSPTPSQGQAHFEGTYRKTVDWPTVPHGGCSLGSDDEIPGPVTYELSLKDGTAQIFEWPTGNEASRETGFEGSYTIFDNQLRVKDSMVTFTVGMRSVDGQLTLSNMDGGLCDDALIWTTGHWTRQ